MLWCGIVVVDQDGVTAAYLGGGWRGRGGPGPRPRRAHRKAHMERLGSDMRHSFVRGHLTLSKVINKSGGGRSREDGFKSASKGSGRSMTLSSRRDTIGLRDRRSQG